MTINRFGIMAAAAVVAAALAGCAPGTVTTDIGPAPKEWRKKVADHVRQSFFDPYSIRDAEVSDPIPTGMVFDGVTPIPHSGWMVCLKANGKNRFGAYAGLQLTGILFENGVITTTTPSVPATSYTQTSQHCASAKYSPFSI